MDFYQYILIGFSSILVLGTFLPALRLTHWVYRNFDYVRVQVLALLIIVLILGLIFFNQLPYSLTIPYFLLIGLSIYFQISIIFPYLPNKRKQGNTVTSSFKVSIISSNVYQDNNEYSRFLKLIENKRPNIVFTLETNKDWEDALASIEKWYPNSLKIAKENTYGMHFYTDLEVISTKEHYFISEERPAIEAILKDNDGNEFVFWGIHPPPPSPTELPTSKQKDAELITLAQLIQKSTKRTIVVGDFNNVCWSRIAKLFGKISGLKDARLNNGILGTFPVKPAFLRFPIDLLFHSQGIHIQTFTTLADIGSDHLPLFTEFHIDASKTSKENEISTSSKNEADTIIDKGIKANKEEDH